MLMEKIHQGFIKVVRFYFGVRGEERGKWGFVHDNTKDKNVNGLDL